MKLELSIILLSFIDLSKIIIPVVCTFLAGYIGVVYGLKQIKVWKKLDFVEQQLREFYSPLLGYHKEIWAKSELRIKINESADEA